MRASESRIEQFVPGVTDHHLKGGAVAVGLFLLAGVVTDLLATPLFTRMVPRSALDYLFLGSTSLFAGVYVTQRSRTRASAGERCAVGGTLGGALAFACPVCNHLLLALASTSAVMTYFDPLRPAIGGLSVVLLGGAVLLQHRTSADC